MISRPEATCPRCGSRLTVLFATDVSQYAETVTYYCECECGAASLTVKHGEILNISLRDPIQEPEEDIPEYTQEDPEYAGGFR